MPRKPTKSTDDAIIHQRIAGRSVREIAKARRTIVAEFNAAIDRWADSTIDDKTRKNTFALELSRLGELQEVFYQRALEGDVQRGARADAYVADCRRSEAEGNEHGPDRGGAQRADHIDDDPTTH